ncbi:MAG: superoxide dismutase [Bacteroidales bacterium]
MDKRTFLKTSAAIGAASFIAPKTSLAEIFPFQFGNLTLSEKGKYILPPLPYSYSDLEPIIDEETLKIHHDKHHAGYVNGLNKTTDEIKKAINNDDFKYIGWLENQLAFNGAGHFLHSIYWNSINPDKQLPSGTIKKYLEKSFGSFKKFKRYFIESTAAVQASGWGILCYQAPTDKLVILQAEKHQDLSQWINIPIIAIDVWEHAYYLSYQNKRKEYLEEIFYIINWNWANQQLEAILK